MTHFLQTFIKLKSYFLILNKILAVLFICYFLYNYKSYSLTFNLPLWLTSYSYISNTVAYLDYIGLSFLVIPLTLILVSLLFSEIKTLNILASLLSLSTNIFSVVIGYTRGTLQDFVNAKIFTVYNIYSLETKKTILSS